MVCKNFKYFKCFNRNCMHTKSLLILRLQNDGYFLQVRLLITAWTTTITCSTLPVRPEVLWSCNRRATDACAKELAWRHSAIWNAMWTSWRTCTAGVQGDACVNCTYLTPTCRPDTPAVIKNCKHTWKRRTGVRQVSEVQETRLGFLFALYHPLLLTSLSCWSLSHLTRSTSS